MLWQNRTGTVPDLPERIYKLQPDRTVHLRGFDSFAAAAAIHSASSTGFTVSGTFRDPADFAVAVLYDADNCYEHPSLRYLPDFDFSGLALRFNLRYSSGLQPIDSPKYNWIDWATLDCILADGTRRQVRLWDNAMLVDPVFPAASATCNLVTTEAGVADYDRVTLWFQNLAFDYIAPPSNPSVEFLFFAGGSGTVHQIAIDGRVYSHTESAPGGEGSAEQATALIAAINGAPDADVVAEPGSQAHAVKLSVRPARAGAAIPVTASDGNAAVTLRANSCAAAAAAIAAQVNATDWMAANTTHALLAGAAGTGVTLTAARYGKVQVSGTSVQWESGAVFSGIVAGDTIRIGGAACVVASVESPQRLTLAADAGSGNGMAYVAPRGGSDGNLISLRATAKNAGLRFEQEQIDLSGGRSDVTWNCHIDFAEEGIDQLRQCWLTFAPSLVNAAYAATEWEAVFSNWLLTGDEDRRALQVAGCGTVRIEETDSACRYQGEWTVESGFYSRYFAKATRDMDAALTVGYTSQFTHDLYLGTSLYSDRAVAGIRLDGDVETSLDCRLQSDSAVNTRRLIRRNVAAGRHTVSIRLLDPGVFYFDFLEAAVPADFPDGLPSREGISPALDFDTDHTYKVSPARLLWSFDKLGYGGTINEYLGVFWWNERAPSGGSVSSARIDFSGTFSEGDSVFLTLNGATLGKSVFPADTPASIAHHFAAFINSVFVGAWASATEGSLAITARSPAPAYNLTLAVSAISAAGLAQVVSSPSPGRYATWTIDDTAGLPLNRAARDWHRDLYSLCAARHREIVTSCSLELVNPPEGYAARFPDGEPVATATGFGTLVSNHCAAGSSKMLAYQKSVYRQIARLQADAGLIPSVQFGEFLWWYFEDHGGMAFCDAETLVAAQLALGRPLHIFTAQDDDPQINDGEDARFLRNRLRDHVQALVSDLRSAFPNVRCELLWPYDVNYPTRLPSGRYDLGGRLNRFVNLPVEWEEKASSGLDTMKVEALAFATGMRNLDLVREAANLFPALGWPVSSLRYLLPVFGSATPWHRELALAHEAGVRQSTLWAYDHICLYNLEVPEKTLDRRSVVKAA